MKAFEKLAMDEAIRVMGPIDFPTQTPSGRHAMSCAMNGYQEGYEAGFKKAREMSAQFLEGFLAREFHSCAKLIRVIMDAQVDDHVQN